MKEVNEHLMVGLAVLLMALVVAASTISLVEVKKANDVIDEVYDYRFNEFGG